MDPGVLSSPLCLLLKKVEDLFFPKKGLSSLFAVSDVLPLNVPVSDFCLLVLSLWFFIALIG